MRAGVDFGEVIRSAFPPGSVTGREDPGDAGHRWLGLRRGAYCGAIGFLSDCGAARLSVAIRTATIEGEALPGARDGVRGTLTYPVGAGIVAESVPSEEWAETLAKAEAIVRALRAPLAQTGGDR